MAPNRPQKDVGNCLGSFTTLSKMSCVCMQWIFKIMELVLRFHVVSNTLEQILGHLLCGKSSMVLYCNILSS